MPKGGRGRGQGYKHSHAKAQRRKEDGTTEDTEGHRGNLNCFDKMNRTDRMGPEEGRADGEPAAGMVRACPRRTRFVCGLGPA